MWLLENFPLKDHIPIEMRNAVTIILFSHFLVYESDVVKFYEQFAPYKVAVDIGASTGYHTKRLAKLADKVIAIEPLNELKKIPSNVEIHKVAVGRKEGIRKLSILSRCLNFTNAAIDMNNANSYVNVRMVPLDSIVTEADFLKIDTEGYELEILEGAKVMENLKYIAIEFHREGLGGPVKYQQGLFRVLKDFHIYFNDIGRYIVKDDIPLSPEYGHLFCIRKEEI